LEIARIKTQPASPGFHAACFWCATKGLDPAELSRRTHFRAPVNPKPRSVELTRQS